MVEKFDDEQIQGFKEVEVPEVEEIYSIGEAIADIVVQRADNVRDYIGISEVPYCIRKTYLKHTTMETGVKRKQAFRMMAGTAFHKELQSILWEYRKALSEKGIVYRKVEKDVKLTYINNDMKEQEIPGHVDWVLTYNGEDMVADIKTTTENGFRFIKEPRPQDVIQLNGYLYATGHNTGMLLYMTDTGRIKVFLVRRNDEVVTDIISRHKELVRCIDEKEMPEVPYNSPDESWECPLCPFQDYCWKSNQYEFEKVEGEVMLDTPLDTELIKLENQKKEIEASIAKITNTITRDLKGRTGVTKHFKFIFVPPTKYMAVNADKVKALLPEDKLREVLEEKSKRGYYMRRVIKQKEE